jgi:phosphate-selective porin OprO/OprP
VDLIAVYSGFGEHLKLTLGRQKTQFGMQWVSSNANLTIAERSAVAELYTERRLEGITFSGELSHNLHYWFGIYDNNGATGTTKTSRLTYSHILKEQNYVHLGTGFVNSGERETYNIELAIGNGPFHIQSEFFSSSYDAPLTGDRDGYYVEAGYFLNGTSFRPYKNGIFRSVQPTGSKGDLQLVTRYESGDGNYSDIGFGREHGSAYVIGVNWYLNKEAGLYISYASGQMTATSEEGRELRIRAQYLF